ncbi:MAG TPA: orotidine-5'-phosphate decarboxylase [Chitinophagales bacterium]|nr:orotidine-5'-phosphate decarboxylase [Chitinophagales bacterium]
MTREEIFDQIKSKHSFLCIGLDTDPEKIPKHLLSSSDPVFEFNKQIIDATHDLCVAYKINTAFYEANGVMGWESMKKTFDYIPKDIFTIADAKRGDIGNTSAMYARAFFEKEKSGFDFDAITVAPYMGKDSVTPFLQYKNKFVILLALTSNKGSQDFQLSSRLTTSDSGLLYEEVILKSQQWSNADNMMYVIGATHPEMFAHVRALAPDHFFLVPGVGTQGGDLKMIAENGMNKQCGLLANVSRNIIYASMEKDFAEAARGQAHQIQFQMKSFLIN